MAPIRKLGQSPHPVVLCRMEFWTRSMGCRRRGGRTPRVTSPPSSFRTLSLCGPRDRFLWWLGAKRPSPQHTRSSMCRPTSLLAIATRSALAANACAGGPGGECSVTRPAPDCNGRSSGFEIRLEQEFKHPVFFCRWRIPHSKCLNRPWSARLGPTWNDDVFPIDAKRFPRAMAHGNLAGRRPRTATRHADVPPPKSSCSRGVPRRSRRASRAPGWRSRVGQIESFLGCRFSNRNRNSIPVCGRVI